MIDTTKYPSANPNKIFFIADSYLPDKKGGETPPFTCTKSFSFRLIFYSFDYLLPNLCKKYQNSPKQVNQLQSIANQKILMNLYESDEARDAGRLPTKEI